jgi:hypothetical protein
MRGAKAGFSPFSAALRRKYFLRKTKSLAGGFLAAPVLQKTGR